MVFFPVLCCSLVKRVYLQYGSLHRLPEQDSQLQTQDGTGVPSITQDFAGRSYSEAGLLTGKEQC